ncbi:MAG: hypothetical protein UGF89_11280 [Acutalibacteraceae bacterium]|nr:hypothetical protein [Acutalibacteraceae bacterium]
MEALAYMLLIILGAFLIIGIIVLPYYLIYWLIKKAVIAGNKELIESNTRNTTRVTQRLDKLHHNYVAVNAPDGSGADKTIWTL